MGKIRTRDMEIKNKLTVTRGEREGNDRERRGRGKSRNMCRGLMGMDNRMGIDYGSKVEAGGWQGGGVGSGTTVIEQQLKQEREMSISCLSNAPKWRSGLQPRHVS